MTPRCFEALSPTEIEQIQAASMNVLEEAGIGAAPYQRSRRRARLRFLVNAELAPLHSRQSVQNGKGAATFSPHQINSGRGIPDARTRGSQGGLARGLDIILLACKSNLLCQPRGCRQQGQVWTPVAAALSLGARALGTASRKRAVATDGPPYRRWPTRCAVVTAKEDRGTGTRHLGCATCGAAASRCENETDRRLPACR